MLAPEAASLSSSPALPGDFTPQLPPCPIPFRFTLECHPDTRLSFTLVSDGSLPAHTRAQGVRGLPAEWTFIYLSVRM